MLAFLHRRTSVLALLAFALLGSRVSLAQMSTGRLAGHVRDTENAALAGATIAISSGLNFRAAVTTDDRGEFVLVLPYGRYELTIRNGRAPESSAADVDIEPLQNQNFDLILASSGRLRVEAQPADNSGVWAGSPREPYPTGYTFASTILDRNASTATQPLNFSGLGDNRLAWQSQRGFSWTGTQFKLLGMDATDAFQPGRPLVLPNVNSLDEIVARSAFAQTTSTAYGTEIDFFPSQPSTSWHGDVFTSDTGTALTSSNLPPVADRGMVQQSEEYRWFTRDAAEAGGALAKWADFFISTAGQWSSQTIPIASPGNDLNSRMLFGDMRLRMKPDPRDTFDLFYSGSRVNLSNWAMPAGLEVLGGQRMAPAFSLPFGFANESEADQFNFLQAGWSRTDPDTAPGSLGMRYQYSVAHLNTTPLHELSQSRLELLGGNATGAPPFANDAAQIEQQVNLFWQPRSFHAFALQHHITAAFGFETASPTNRFSTPSDMNLITAAGAPAFAVQFNTPAENRSIIRSSTLAFADRVELQRSLSLDFGIMADLARGSLPAQSRPAGNFAPARAFATQSDLIAWNSLSPRVGFAWAVPHADGLVLRGTYFRVYMPLAGRYLDFGNPNSLGGSEYQWSDRNGDELFQPNELGPLIFRFGGAYSSISPTLARPFADEFDVGAEIEPVRPLDLHVSFFRRDDKNRLAAVNTGVPFSDFAPVSIADPGPDGVTGTFDDQTLTVYQQNPATFGQDHYLLTNPADLRMLNKGMEADIRAAWRNLFADISFVAEEAYGPTNPENAVFENDPGVLGSLYMDPNTLVNASGRSFMDRAFLGKVQLQYKLPLAIRLAAIIDYNDGLVFARQLLVTGLAQGPFVIDATRRGTILNDPLSGNRAQGIINGNLRVERQFRLRFGSVTGAMNIFNIANSGYEFQQNETSGTSFNQRLPVEIQPPRFAQIELRYSF